jgi:hypothetical protein
MPQLACERRNVPVKITTCSTEQVRALVAEGRRVLDRVAEEQLDPYAINAAYQEWYTRALDLVQRRLPHRLEEFASYYRAPPGTETRTSTIADFLANPLVPAERRAGLSEIFDPAKPRQTFLHLFDYQLAILGSACSRLNRLDQSSATLLRGELRKAQRLLRAGHRRSAGILAGSVFRQCLQIVAEPTVAPLPTTATDLCDALGASGALDGRHWRTARRLARVADRCEQAGKSIPKRQQLRSLIKGVEEILKSLS